MMNLVLQLFTENAFKMDMKCSGFRIPLLTSSSKVGCVISCNSVSRGYVYALYSLFLCIIRSLGFRLFAIICRRKVYGKSVCYVCPKLGKIVGP